jgi:hypothetical protein
MRRFGFLIAISLIAGVEFRPIRGQPKQSGRADVSSSNILDVTAERPPAKPRGIGGYAGGGSSHKQRAVIAPFSVTLLSLNKSRYRLNERAIFEAMLENVTGDNIVIPWSDDRDSVDPDEHSQAPGYIDAFISLLMDDGEGDEESSAAKMLSGSQLVPSSLKELRPGERVIIRAAGPLTMSDPAFRRKVESTLPRTFGVRARFYLNRPSKRPDVEFKTSVSGNSLQVMVRKPR